MDLKQTHQRAIQESRVGKNLSAFTLISILREYENQLKFPRVKPKQQFLLCPVGMVGAGKTTVLKPLSQRLHLLRISTDELRMILLARGYNLVKTSEMAKKLIEKYLAKGFSIAVDADCVSLEVHKSLIKLGKKYKTKTIWIHVKSPEKFILKRLHSYTHGRVFRDSTDAIDNYYRRKPLHLKLDFPFIYQFNTARGDLIKQINRAVNLIRFKMKQS